MEFFLVDYMWCMNVEVDIEEKKKLILLVGFFFFNNYFYIVYNLLKKVK